MFFTAPSDGTTSIADDRRFIFRSTRYWSTWTASREDVFRSLLAPYVGQPVRFLEIGSFEGASTLWMLRNVLTHPDATITCIDNNKLRRGRRLLTNLRRSGFESKATIHWINSSDLRSHVPDNHFDFVYVDGSHAAPNVLFDVVNAFMICKPGGLVGCDDYLFDKPEAGSLPKPAIDTFLELMQDRLEIVHNAYQLWFRKR